MHTLLQIQLLELRTMIALLWTVSTVLSANILLHVWKKETEEEPLTLLSYFGAAVFGLFMGPVICGVFFLFWLGTITPSQVRNWFRDKFKFKKMSKPQFTTGRNSGIVITPNPQAIYTTSFGPPYINDAMNPKPASHPVPNMGRGTRSGPNRMTRVSNGSYGKGSAPSWYVPLPPAAGAKKA